MADRPGIMFYFDLLSELEDFTTQEVGELFLAAMRYGMTGETPKFSDRGMKALWHTVAKSVDRDAVKFDKKILQRQYAGWKSSQKKAGAKDENLPSFDEWLADPHYRNKPTTVNDRQQPLTEFNEINQQSTINYQQSTINYQQSTINSQQSSVICHLSAEEEMQEGEPEPPENVKALHVEWIRAKESDDPETAMAIRKKLPSFGYDLDQNGSLKKTEA